ncbi:SacI homology domain-containing protein [Emericellopsis atlantica]|uniref:SacI homology domain-containing protein n=1 Tax=Emericellopsis atlantica TaxID=2614577 RepID=A0A9P7ZSK8_9HYPO|nr:SacI homology domain-containing protein [Emericellopsis atlantica]KAG9257558.1 SacI homology domain-containing protein [Emericellopsis atlantica]
MAEPIPASVASQVFPEDLPLPAEPEPAQRPPEAPVFPSLQHNDQSSRASSEAPLVSTRLGEADNDDEATVAKPFVRTASPDSGAPRAHTAMPDKDDKTPDRLAYKMHKFNLYETASRYYIVGVDVSEKWYRILKIDCTGDGSELSMTDDKIVYSLKQMNQLLDTIDHGNRGTGGIKLRCTTWGLLGFIKFTGPYYMLLITKKSTVAMIGGHYIYQIEGTELVPLVPSRFKTDSRNTEEQRFLGILNNLDLTRSFYYSYSYDVTGTLQHNVTRERENLAKGQFTASEDDLNSMFVWNDYLLQPAVKALRDPFDWCRPIIHGYIDQAALSIYGRTAHITVIARRSRYFAGARFLKRGANDLGYVANDVETEQIVAESLTTSFHAPGPRLYCSPQYTSYVQHRGSIPLYWTQDNTGVTPRPPIEVNLVDPFYSAAALHFDNLFERYGAPVYVVNLIKSKERQPRESKLLDEYTDAINYLNQFLPVDKKIIHKAWDMSRASKVRGGDVIGNLEVIAESVLKTTGFFQNGDGETSPMSAQNGVARTNCIDCLDRTNAAQFVIGKRALGHQLHALGIIEDVTVEYDTDAVNLFTHMWHDHGDTIAVQYGGSQLVNTMETYRKINQWTSHSRDMIESFKRYYNNSFLDSQRQEAYNLFLGNYIFAHGQPMLWDLATDYYLHHANPRDWSNKAGKGYINWYTPEFLAERKLPPLVPLSRSIRARPVEFFDDYWLEYYRPSTLSSFPKMFAYKMNSTIKYIPFKSTQDGRYDLSPFRVRTDADTHAESKKHRRGVSLISQAGSPLYQQEGVDDDTASIASGQTASRGIQRWLQMPAPQGRAPHPFHRAAFPPTQIEEAAPERKNSTMPEKSEKSKSAQWTFQKAVIESLNPTVEEHEEADYVQYIQHPQQMPLVTSTDTPVDVDASEYQEYVSGDWQAEGLMVTGDEEEIALYAEMLKVGENPLTVTEEDGPKKRYKAYRKWLRGKSFFKQQPLD